MNFVTEFEKGQAGGNKGLYMGKGLDKISKAVNGTQKGRIIGVAGASKSGKSTFVDYAFVINAYLSALQSNTPLVIHYYSFELNRITKEFDFACYFLHEDYKITKIELPKDVLYSHEGKLTNVIELSPDYLRGRIIDNNGEIIKVNEDIVALLKKVYKERIIPMFGKYDNRGNQIEKGIIQFIEKKNNPTGFYRDWIEIAKSLGKFKEEKYGNSIRLTQFQPNDENLQVIIVYDHLRKVMLERGFQLKQAVDKLLEYMVEIRDLCGFTFIPIIHTNRNIASVESLKFYGDEIYPNSDSLKDSGNLSEDCDYLFTIFNPNDERYKLTSHFGIKLKDNNKNPFFPNLRTVHLVESRHCIFPQHFSTNMLGNYKTFKTIKLIKNE